jgi:hypothetical protein
LVTVFLRKDYFRPKKKVTLAFEQRRFYNPHHHPEMPRTLQSPGRRVGHGENYSRMHYDQAVVCRKDK